MLIGLFSVHPDDTKRVEDEWLRTIDERQPALFEHTFTNGNYVQQQWEPLNSEIGECERSQV